jgi:hypothetical protein
MTPTISDMSVAYQPPAQHHCGPNRYGYWLDACFDAVGTVRECGCGKTWVAFRDHYDVGYVGVKWRREGWLARRRRVRRSSQ